MIYIRTSNIIASRSGFDIYVSQISKINYPKEIMDELCVFTREFRAIHDVRDAIQTRISLY